jgi:hypothetical protein
MADDDINLAALWVAPPRAQKLDLGPLARAPVPIGPDEPRRHGIASAKAICGSKPSVFAMSR